MITLSPSDYDAVLFDLDGVLTPTARVHAAAWKRVFDDFLARRANDTGEAFVPFDATLDYRRYVDGKPRQDGVVAFLTARHIELPLGRPDDGRDVVSVYGLGSRKDRDFLEELRQHGVEPYASSTALARALRAEHVKTAVVSSSNHCAEVLAAAGIDDLFDVRVDGRDLARLGLRGKPAPDAFLEGARRLGVERSRTVVVEDAIAGVEAGRAGQFGLVIGVDRADRSTDLRRAGADVVVTDLAQVRVAGESPSAWSLVYDGFDAAQEGIRESLCALGNGHFETRAASPASTADDVHYPGTYLAGGYNRLRTDIQGRSVENEELVNLPNWLPLTIRIGDGEWFDERRVSLLEYRQELDLRHGLLLRTIRFDAGGKRTLLRERRLVSMDDCHVAALELSITAENWSGAMTIRSAIDGRVINGGAKLYRKFQKTHLVPVSSAVLADDTVSLVARTTQSGLHVAEAARTEVLVDGERVTTPRQLLQQAGYIGQEVEVSVATGQTVVVEKIVSFYTSRDDGISEPAHATRTAIARLDTFAALMNAHVRAWKQLWDRFDVDLQPAHAAKLNVLMLLRLNTFHLLQTVSVHSIGNDIGVPARGWTGEGYQGHVFWDELFIFPFFNCRIPEITRSLLMYRYRRLGEARSAAKRAGLKGAMFPWQSGSNGEEVTQEQNLNPRSERWVRDNSYLQRHVGSAIAYNVWQYFQVTHDLEFLEFYGAELLLDIARFWSSLAVFNDARGRYDIRGVMGPDEFHDAYPDAPTPGLVNNAYTNVMAVWVLWRALDTLRAVSTTRRAELTAGLQLTDDDIARWEDITRRMFVPFHPDGVISQFEGYETLREFDWDAYRARYDNTQRLDLILEAEDDSPNGYKLSKQADALMLFYVFSADELRALFERMGYPWDATVIPRTVAYYDRRTSQGSTLSRVVHAWVFASSDRERSLRYFAAALQSDVSDVQGGTTREGIHLGAMAGTVDLVLRATTGIVITDEVIRFNPQLPREIDRLEMGVRYRGYSLDLRLTHDAFTVTARDPGPAPIRVGFGNTVREFRGGTVSFPMMRTSRTAVTQ
jgi:beta-phosphoglucomutase family hydrolase